MDQDTDRLIQVVHYHNNPTEFHSIPFRFAAIKVITEFINSLSSQIFIDICKYRVNHSKRQKRDYKREQA